MKLIIRKIKKNREKHIGKKNKKKKDILPDADIQKKLLEARQMIKTFRYDPFSKD